MPGLRIHGGDDPVLGHPPSDPEHAVAALVEVLADDDGPQRGGPTDGIGELCPVEHGEQRHRIAGQRVDQF